MAGEGAVRLHDHLLDLPEELLTRVLLALPDAAALCRAAQVCRSLATMASQDRLWIERLRRDLGVVDTMRPDQAGARRFHSFSSLDTVSWRRLTVGSRDNSHHILQFSRPSGRTGAASCHMGGTALIFGGTLGGNWGPMLDDLYSVTVDAAREHVTVRCVSLGEREEDGQCRHEMGDGPGPRRGHTMTAVQLGSEPAAVVVGGWGALPLDMQPYVLTPTSTNQRGFAWTAPQISGTPPASRAFHSATSLGGAAVLIYGGLGGRSCRNDFALLDLAAGTWSQLDTSGTPLQSSPGRAGHGAIFVPESSPWTGGAAMDVSAACGRLFLVSGAARGVTGDAYEDTVDVVNVKQKQTQGSRAVALSWSADKRVAAVKVQGMRTGMFAQIGRHIVMWGGVGRQRVTPQEMVTDPPETPVHALNVDTLQVHEVVANSIPWRSGMLAIPLRQVPATAQAASDDDVGSARAAPGTARTDISGICNGAAAMASIDDAGEGATDAGRADAADQGDVGSDKHPRGRPDTACVASVASLDGVFIFGGESDSQDPDSAPYLLFVP